MPRFPTVVRTTNDSLAFISSVWSWIFQTSSAPFLAAQSSSPKIPQQRLTLCAPSNSASMYPSTDLLCCFWTVSGCSGSLCPCKNEPHNPTIWAEQYCSMSHCSTASRVKTLPTSPSSLWETAAFPSHCTALTRIKRKYSDVLWECGWSQMWRTEVLISHCIFVMRNHINCVIWYYCLEGWGAMLLSFSSDPAYSEHSVQLHTLP